MSISKNLIRFVTFVEWLLVLPAAVFLTAALLRNLQPREYEPARTSWLIVDWTIRTVPGLTANVFLLGLPALVALVGCATLLRAWRTDETLRPDTTAVAGAFWRHRVIALLCAAMVVAMAIVVLVVGHHVADLPR